MAHKYKKRSYKRKFKERTLGRPWKNLKTLVSTIINKKTETKYLDVGSENIQLYHNLGPQGAAPLPGAIPNSLIDFFDLVADIVEGTTRSGRIVDKIQPIGMKLKCLLYGLPTRLTALTSNIVLL